MINSFPHVLFLLLCSVRALDRRTLRRSVVFMWLGRGGAEAARHVPNQAVPPAPTGAEGGSNLSSSIEAELVDFEHTLAELRRDFEEDLAQAKEEEKALLKEAEANATFVAQATDPVHEAKAREAAKGPRKEGIVGMKNATHELGSRGAPAVAAAAPALTTAGDATAQAKKKRMMVAAAWIVPGEKGEKGVMPTATRIQEYEARRGQAELNRLLRAEKLRDSAAPAANDWRAFPRFRAVKKVPLSVRAVVYVVAVWMTMRIVARLTQRGVLGAVTFILIVSAAARVLARCLNLQGG